jgi:UDP-glucose 4-epimerase
VLFGIFEAIMATTKNRPRVISVSSGAVFQPIDQAIDEDSPVVANSPYAASKLAGEAYCSAFYRSYGLETVALRFGNVYGPGSTQKNSVVAKFIKQALAGETLEIYGDGNQTRDFIFIDDLIDAVLLSSSVEGVGGEIFQIATSRESTVNELVEVLLRALQTAGVGNTRVSHTPTRKGDVKRNFSDTSKAGKILGWHANVEMREGITRTVEWFLREISSGFHAGTTPKG